MDIGGVKKDCIERPTQAVIRGDDDERDAIRSPAPHLARGTDQWRGIADGQRELLLHASRVALHRFQAMSCPAPTDRRHGPHRADEVIDDVQIL